MITVPSKLLADNIFRRLSDALKGVRVRTRPISDPAGLYRSFHSAANFGK